MRPEGLALLERDLEIDRALSAGQLARHHGLTLEKVQECVHVFERSLAPTHGSRTFRPVRFVSLEGSLSGARGSELRHLAGLAEMRRMLGANPEVWRHKSDLGGEQPDALWDSPEGAVAVEFDAGSYSPAQILAKVKYFTRHAAQVWGSPSRIRARHLTGFLEVVGETRATLVARWD